MGNKVINIRRDFSRYPAGRYTSDGPYSGQAFRDTLLVPALKNSSGKVVVEFDEARGYGSSFLEEAFGGLVRIGFTEDEILERLDLKSQDASLIEEVKGYISDQSKLSHAPGM